jgi:hypothetical protein
MVVASLENVVSVCLSFCLSLRIRTHQLDEQSLLCIHKRDQCTPRPSFGCLLAVRAKRTERSQQRQRVGKWSISLWRSAHRDSNSFHNQWRRAGQRPLHTIAGALRGIKKSTGDTTRDSNYTSNRLTPNYTRNLIRGDAGL